MSDNRNPQLADITLWVKNLERDLKLYLQNKYIASKSSLRAFLKKIFLSDDKVASRNFHTQLFANDTPLNQLLTEKKSLLFITKDEPETLQILISVNAALHQMRKWQTNGSLMTATDLSKNPFEGKPVHAFFQLTDEYEGDSVALRSILVYHRDELARISGVLPIISGVIVKTHVDTNTNYANQIEQMDIKVKNFRIPGANDSLKPWLVTLKTNLKLFLQQQYLDNHHSFFADLFADIKKPDMFARLLFSPHSSLQEVLLHHHFAAFLQATPNIRLAVQATFWSIINPMETINPHILNKPAKDPECSALLQQLLKNFLKICNNLEKDDSNSALLPILKSAYIELAAVAEQESTITLTEDCKTNCQHMQENVQRYIAKHPVMFANNDKPAPEKVNTDETAETSKQIVDNTLLFP
jgi:hypothetical protein